MHDLIQGKEADVFIDGGILNKLFKNTSTGHFSAKVEHTVLDFLTNQSFSVPASLGIIQINNRSGLKMNFIPGQTLQEDFFTVGHGQKVGRVLGKLHYDLHNISIDTLPNNLPRLFNEAEVEFVLAHGDFHPANIIDNNGNYVVIDWSRSYIGPSESDIASTLIILLLFKLPPDNYSENELKTFNENLFDTKREYINTYNKLKTLNIDLIIQLAPLVARRFSTNDEIVMNLVSNVGNLLRNL
jgi:tRNA A-37 threonylcarbamoyl transferase component Bud32